MKPETKTFYKIQILLNNNGKIGLPSEIATYKLKSLRDALLKFDYICRLLGNRYFIRLLKIETRTIMIDSQEIKIHDPNIDREE